MKHLFSLLFYIFFITYSVITKAQTIDVNSEGFQSHNVLRYDIHYTTTEPALTFVEYYHTSPLSSTQYTNITIKDTTHKITIIGLLSETQYFYRIHVFNTEGTYQGDWNSFTTKALPENLPEYFSEILPSDSVDISYVLTNDLDIPGISQTLLVIDNHARIVWYEQIPTTLSCFNITPQNTIIYSEFIDNTLSSPNFNKVIELQLNGERILEFDNTYLMHHEIAYAANNEIYALATDVRTIDRSSIGGSPTQTVVGDPIIVLNRDGELVWEWTPFQIFDPLIYIGITGFWDSIYGTNSEDWLHGNALYKDIDGNYLVSLQGHNQIIKVNTSTGQLMWTLGENGTLSFPDSSLFAGQHAIYTTKENTYMLFDNGGAVGFRSRVQEIEVDTLNETARVIWQYVLPQNLFSFATSSAYKLDNKNVLICSGFPGHILEVTPDGEVVWEISSNGSQYRAYHLPYLYPPLETLQSNFPSTICLNDDLIQPTATPSDGFFEGNGIQNGQFNPQLAGVGTHTISYTYGWESISQEITVVEAPQKPIIQQEQDTLKIENTYTNASFQWFLNEESIPDATQTFYVPNQSGNYTVAVTNEVACSVFAPTVNVVLTDVVNPQNLPITIHTYPNPTSDFFFIDYTLKQVSQVKIDLYQIDGSFKQNLLQQQQAKGQYQQKIDLDKLVLSNGLYIVHITINQQSHYQKILVHN